MLTVTKFARLLLPTVLSFPLLLAEESAHQPPQQLGAAVQLARKVVDLDTHQVTYIRIVPPSLPARPVPPSTPTVEPTPEQLAAEQAREAKIFRHLFISVTVYPATETTFTVSDLNWWHEGKRYQAWSNVDFRLLSQITELETATHVFCWFPCIGESLIEDISADGRPAGFSLFTPADTAPHYYFEGTEADMAAVEDTLIGLDHFHAYYQLHQAKLAADYVQRSAEAAARAAELAKNPPKAVDTVIHFWRVPSVSAAAAPSTP